MAIKLRKKAPFFCRAVGVDGKTLIHFSHPLAESDGDLCPEHEAARKARNAKAHAPIKRVDEPVVPTTKEPEPPMRRIWPD